jgi:hypothetical protein
LSVKTFHSNRKYLIFNKEIYQLISPTTITIKSPSDEQIFSFDKILPEEITQDDFFEETLSLLDEFIYNRKNVLIFNYGKSNTGKTYTMIGI